MKSTLQRIIFFSLVFAVAGCQSANELHYFRSGGNYYRLKIDERSFASKARYLSGYFDEKAVDKYFSEMSQPDSGKFIDWVSSQGRGSQLVMILSTNSTSIAEQIGNLASNEDLLENVALLANKDKIEQGKLSANRMKELKITTDNIIAVGEAYFPTATTANINQNIKDFLTTIQQTVKGKLDPVTLNATISKYK